MDLVRIGFILIVLLWPSVGFGQLLNPGPLHKTHSGQSGDSNCSKCHESGKRVSKALCLDCHTDLRSRMNQGRGLHGRKYKGKNCEKCHIEHIGKNSRLIRWPGGNKIAFPHNDTGWPLQKSHRKAACADCHNKKNSRGHSSYLTAKTDCASCHDDPHKKRFGSKCKDCHGESTWKEGAAKNFDHNLSKFSLKGKHASVECKECHGQPPKYKGIQFNDCTACHKDPHNGRFSPKTCASCHVEKDWKEIGKFRTQHPGVSLKGGHKRVNCKKCHDRGNSNRPSKGKACAKCHKPVHIAKFGRNCKKCHASIQWSGLPDRVGRKNHSKTQFPLVGKHQQTKCSDCHPQKSKLSQRYRGIAFKQCLGCHNDQHKGTLNTQKQGADCNSCHTQFGFWPTRFGVVEHKKTSFPLAGRHVSTPCVRCHTDKRPRIAFTIAEKDCVGCHENPHGEQFAVEMKKEGCATCHNAGGWSRPNIDHSSWPLTGAHETVDCNACHKPSKKDRALGSGATYRGIPKTCEGCHQDLHLGQFRLKSPKRPCEFCHDTKKFSIPKFPHTSKASFELDGKHKKLKCEQCHKKSTLSNGKEAVRYRLGYRKCKDCHANPHASK